MLVFAKVERLKFCKNLSSNSLSEAIFLIGEGSFIKSLFGHLDLSSAVIATRQLCSRPPYDLYWWEGIEMDEGYIYDMCFIPAQWQTIENFPIWATRETTASRSHSNFDDCAVAHKLQGKVQYWVPSHPHSHTKRKAEKCGERAEELSGEKAGQLSAISCKTSHAQWTPSRQKTWTFNLF